MDAIVLSCLEFVRLPILLSKEYVRVLVIRWHSCALLAAAIDSVNVGATLVDGSPFSRQVVQY